MFGILEEISEKYDSILEDEPETEYGIPVFYNDEELYDHLYEE